MTFRAAPKQILKAVAWGFLAGAASYGAYRLLGGAPDRAEGLWKILWILLMGPVLEEIVFRGLARWPSWPACCSAGSGIEAGMFSAPSWPT